MEKTIQVDSWQVRTCRASDETVALMHALQQNDHRQILKDDSQTLVYRITHAGEDLVVKSPRRRNRSGVERLRTLVRAGKAMRMWRGLCKLHELEISVPEPVLLAQRRRWGMIVDSFLVYRYVPGEPITAADIPAVDALLDRLHAYGYLRHDPGDHNYLKSGNDIVCIDVTLRKPFFFKKTQCLLEHLSFHQHRPEMWLFYHAPSVPAWQLRTLLAYQRCKSAIRDKRRCLKGKIRNTCNRNNPSV